MKKLFFALLGLIACSLTSKGQENPITTKLYWDSVSEGVWNIPSDGNRNQFFKLGDKVVFPVEKNSGTTPTTIGGFVNLAPLAVFNTTNGDFTNTATNWSGDPVNPMFIHQGINTENFFVFDNKKIFLATVRNDSVVYKQIFQGTDHTFYGFTQGKDNIYFWGYKHIIICSKTGDFIKEVVVNYNAGTLPNPGGTMYSLSEYSGQIYLGFIIGGYGMGTVDINTGEVTIDKSSVSQHGGCKIRLIGDSLYMATEAMDFYKFSSTLYKMRNGKWIPIIAGSKLPELHNGKWYVRITDDDAYYIASKKALGVKENFYEFTPSVDSVIPKTIIYPIRDPRADTIDFWNNYYHRFQNRHGLGNVPIINYVFESSTGAVYGFGNNFVAKLNLHSTSTGFSKKVTLPKVRIYPNPANEQISIIGIRPETPVEILTTTGQITLSVPYTEEGIDLSKLTSGFYLIKINGYQAIKFMKK